MAIFASLKGPNLFSSLPSAPPPNDPVSHSSPPIPIPKYPPKPLKSETHKPPINPAFKTVHRRTKYHRPVREGVISSDGDRAVTIGESGVSYHLPGAPFEFQFSYSETPKAKPIAIREPAFLPFAPPTMPRPWTGKAPLKKSKRKTPLFDSLLPPPPGQSVVKEIPPGAFPFGRYPKHRKSREEILGEPLKKWEIQVLLQQRRGKDNRQINLGRDGLTHNMLELIHSHWKRQSVCKVRCKGVPTVDMKNICKHLEEKTGGKIIHRAGGVVYLYRGRKYDYRTRPQYPVMLWKPAAPVYPKLIQDAPEGLIVSEANELRNKGKKLLPICKLAKNGVYITLVRDVRHAFEASPIVKIDCKGMHASDYKKLGAKLKELVPCVLLSFDDENILIWRGREWKSLYRTPLIPRPNEVAGAETGTKTVRSSPKMMSLWQRAIDSSKAFVLDKTDLGPDELLKKVEEFTGMSQAVEHSYPAVVLASGDETEFQDDPQSQGYGEDDSYYSNSDYDDNDEYYDSDSDTEEITTSAPLGSLPVDQIAGRLVDEKNEKNKWFD